MFWLVINKSCQRQAAVRGGIKCVKCKHADPQHQHQLQFQTPAPHRREEPKPGQEMSKTNTKTKRSQKVGIFLFSRNWRHSKESQ